MYLNNNQLDELCDIAKQAALAAGRIINSKKGSTLDIKAKLGGENIASCVVTEIDHQAQKAILNLITPTLKKFELGLLTEESDDDSSRLNYDYFWCIDPLDGTLCYSKDEEGYSTSIALVSKEGESVVGVVFNPRTEDLYHAIKNHGAYKNDHPLKINNSNNFLTLLYDQSFLKHPNFESELKEIESNALKNGLKSVQLYHLGGAVMNGISTIEKAPAIYYKHPKAAAGGGSIWDFAASSIIQSEAGGFNSNYHGNPIHLNMSESTFMNNQGIIYASSVSCKDMVPNRNQ